MNPKLMIGVLCAAAFTGCVAPMSSWPDMGSASSPYGIPTAARASNEPAPSVLPGQTNSDPIYAWDGGVVDSPKPGSVVESGPSHDVAPTSNGRMYILELYQDAIDERDALQLEVTALGAALERAQLEMDDFSTRMARVESMVTTLTAERDQLRGENSELAARVVTAQIRRLEAEKVLLESKLQWFREADFAAVQKVSELEKSTTETPMMSTEFEPMLKDSTEPMTAEDKNL